MFWTVCSACGNLSVKSYSLPMGVKRVASEPEKLDPEVRSAVIIS
jgi:hypothetical protein